MKTNEQKTIPYFKSLKIIHIALVIGISFFGIFAFIIHYNKLMEVDSPELSSMFGFIVPIFFVGGIAASFILFKRKINSIKFKPKFSDKMFEYRSALILRYALLEGPAFFSLVIYLLLGEWIFLVYAAIIIIIFLTIKPTFEKAVIDLELSPEEQEKLMTFEI
ncbi:MAG: hypothetical protein K9J13_07765 [Saprospiraceae bacterium]|nr:hypothetical protein [Saprospiraceae bacterium]